ncbi:MAG: flagellar basal-body rod protein FlgG, partial [Phycisphaerae bacterium]|nr:flagellar basal-body rod protein FlgG [Phycisphaerae bacterium]
ATGMTAQQQIVDVIANNLANINTTGFKRSQMDFQDLMYVKLRPAGSIVEEGTNSPTGLEIGSGVKSASTVKVFTAGELENTDNPLDVAIQGDGFFQVTGGDGTTYYTRDGSFRVDASGNLVNANGMLLEPNITIPSDAETIQIGQDGTVSVMQPGSVTPSQIGQIQLARFVNPAGLSSEGGNLLSETAASGSATVGTPGDSGLGLLEQGFLERSNVQMVHELVKLITAQRAYEINSRAIKAGDEMLTTANQLIR